MPKLKNSTSRKPLFLILGAVLVIFAGFYLYQQIITLPDDSGPAIFANRKPPGIITNAVVAKTIDPATSLPLVTASSFTRQEINIYLVVSLNNAPIGTRIAYIRFLNDRRVDEKSIAIRKTGQKYLNFDWTLKSPGSLRIPGRYRVKVYTNGIFEKDVTYEIIP